MRKLMTVILTCGGIAIWSAPISAQPTEPRSDTQPQGQEQFCYDKDGPAFCVSTSEQRYELCANLATNRGWQRGGSGGFDRFVYECLTGTIGTAPGN
jgi:hypothetical protein